MKGLVEKSLFEIFASDLGLNSEDKVLSHVFLPDFERVVFEENPLKTRKKHRASEFNTVWENIQNINIPQPKDRKHTRISNKTYKRLEMMSLYSNKFLSNEAIIDNAISYTSNHLAQFYRPDSYHYVPKVYDDYFEILQRTSRFLPVKETTNTLFHFNLTEFCYHPSDLISNMLWLFAKGPATLPTSTKKKKFISDKIYLTLLYLLEPKSYENYGAAKIHISKLLKKYNLQELEKEDGPNFLCFGAAFELMSKFLDEGINYQFFADYGEHILTQNQFRLEKEVGIKGTKIKAFGLDTDYKNLFQDYRSFIDAINYREHYSTNLNKLLIHRCSISPSIGVRKATHL
jgi:hypothetical protein